VFRQKSLRKSSLKYLRVLGSEKGTVESALVLIPTVLLFLSVLQIAASVLGRGVAVNMLQGEISREALLGAPTSIASEGLLGTNNAGSNTVSRIPLPGGGAIITGSRTVSIPKLTPLIISQDKFLVNGIAIDEN